MKKFQSGYLSSKNGSLKFPYGKITPPNIPPFCAPEIYKFFRKLEENLEKLVLYSGSLFWKQAKMTPTPLFFKFLIAFGFGKIHNSLGGNLYHNCKKKTTQF